MIDGFSKPLIAPDRLTVPLLLRQRGYHTAAIGKWHLGFTIVGDKDPDDETKKPAGAPVWAKTADDGLPIGDPNTGGGPPIGAQTTDGPITRGFDYFYGVQHARSLGTFFEQDRATELVKPVDALEKLTRRASKYIADEARGGSPFFLYFALTSPHTPIVPSKAWQGRSGLGSYGDFVMETDWAVGEVLAAIRQAGVEGNTLVIATSDNGFSPLVGTAALEAQGHFPSAQFRGYKSDIWDGGHRVPFIARWPERIKPGTECGELICLADFMATCADILGVQLPPNAGEDSVSILPALLGVKHEPLHEAIVHHSIFGQFAIRQGPWKLEFCPGSGGWDSPTDKSAVSAGLPALQLYNLDQDIGEKRNLQAQYPEVVAKLTTLLRHYIADGRSTPGLPQANDVPVSLTK